MITRVTLAAGDRARPVLRAVAPPPPCFRNHLPESPDGASRTATTWLDRQSYYIGTTWCKRHVFHIE